MGADDLVPQGISNHDIDLVSSTEIAQSLHVKG